MTNKKIDELINSKQVDLMDSSQLPIPKANKKSDISTDNLEFSKEEIEKFRKETLDKLENHVKTVKTMIKKDELADYMLENRIDILEKSKFMLNEFMTSILTSKINDARSFEVLSALIKTVADVNDSVVNIKEDKNKLKDKAEQEKFVKNTAELVGDIIKTNLNNIRDEEKFRNKNKEDVRVISNNKS